MNTPDPVMKSHVFSYINTLLRAKYKTNGPLVPMKISRHFGISIEEASELTKEFNRGV